MGEFLGPTLLGLTVYGFILLMNAFLFAAREALAKDLPWQTVLKLVLYQLPELLILVIPMSTILGVLIAFGRLSADHEVTAMQGAGVGVRSLFGPVLVHGLLLGSLSFAIYAVVVPDTGYKLRILKSQILVAGGMGTNLTPRVFYSDIPGYVLFVSEIRAGAEGKLEGVFIHQDRVEGDWSQSCLAQSGDLREHRKEDGTPLLLADLENCVCSRYRTDRPEHYQIVHYGKNRILIEPPAYFKALSEPPERALQNLHFTGLFQALRDAEASKESPVRPLRIQAAKIEIHQRIALPFACVLFAILGMPLGLTFARSGKGAGFALSTAVVLVYWIIFPTVRDQASSGRVSPFIGVWAANLVVAALAIWAYLSLRPRASDESPVWRAGLRLVAAIKAVASRLPGAARSLAPSSETEDDAPRPSGDAAWTEGAVSRRIVRLVDRHVALQYLRVLAYALLSAYAIFAVVELKGLLDDALRFHKPGSLVLDYFKYFAPGKLGLILPVSCLVAAVVAFTVLGRAGELTALKASGISMRRATVPVLALTLLFCVASFFVEDRLAPITNQKAREVRDRLQGKPPRTYGMPAGGRWTFGTSGRLYNYRLYDPDRKVFQGLSVFTLDRDAPRIVEHRFAALAKWNGTAWVLEKGWRRTFGADNSVVAFESGKSSELAALDAPENFDRREETFTIGGDLAEQLSITELNDQIGTLENSGYDTTRLRVAFQSKMSQPLTPLVMVLLGLPFAFQIGRRGSLYGIGVALLLVIVYWATYAVFNALGYETVLPPLLAAWAPNVLFGFVGAYLLLYVRT
jgi:LPS export ABC transporter permease LptG/LPS export ABC transporter permease LptF